MGMVHAYKKGKLKHAPRKIREVAKHISDEDARDFAKTKHDGLAEKKEKKNEKKAFDFKGIMSKLEKLAAGTPVVVYVDDKPNEFGSMQEAAGFLAQRGSLPAEKIKTLLAERQAVINGLRVEYPSVLPSKEEEESNEGSKVQDLASMFKNLTGTYGASSYGM